MSTKLDTVRKLLAKAEGAATAAEAEIYTAKATALMATHGIDEAMLAAAGEKTDDVEARIVKIDNPYSMEKSQLIGWISAALGCRWTFNYRKGTRKVNYVTLFGFQSDLERAELLYTSLLIQATSQLIEQYPARRDESVAAYRRSWFAGFANEVANRIREAEEAAKEQAVAADVVTPREGVSTELVLMDRKDRVERFYEDTIDGVKLAERKPTRYTGSGFEDGEEAGRRADLGTGKKLARNRRALA